MQVVETGSPGVPACSAAVNGGLKSIATDGYARSSNGRSIQ